MNSDTYRLEREVSSEYNFGIDLGTTDSAIARSSGDEIRVYQNNDQMSVTPSAVRVMKSGRVIVGRRAYDSLIDDPENVATEFKRNIGRKVGKRFPGNGRTMSPEELSAEVLKILKEDVRRQTGEEVERAVITVPAAFATLQCEATSRAATLAGITNTYLLQEPIAAAVAYGAQPDARNKRWLVFDLGGGTLDIAVVSTRNGRLTVLEHRGDNFLGGRDADRIIVDQILLPVLGREFQLPEPGSPERQRLLRRLLRRAEEAKIDLSTRKCVEISISDVGEDRRGVPIELEVGLTRAEFETKIDPLLRTAVDLAHEALSGARLSGSDLDRILLVGGPTQIPHLRTVLAEELGAEVDSSIDPMTVVVRGAAVFASSVEWTETDETLTSTNGVAVVRLGYQKVSSEIEALVDGSVLSSGAEAIKFDVDGGSWSSDWIPLRNGSFDTRLQLMDGKATRFWIYARRKDGALLDIEPNTLSIRHGLVPAAPPLPHSIGIEIEKCGGKSKIDPIFHKGQPLPAERIVQYRAARELRRTQPDRFLAIKVWEGETAEDPEANQWVSAMPIFGRYIKRAIPENAEINLHVKIDESRKISVNCFLPHSNESFSTEIYVPDRDQEDPKEQLKQLPNSIGQLLERLDAVETSATCQGDFEISSELDTLRSEVETVDMATSGSACLTDDPDSTSRLLAQIKKVRASLAAIERKTGADESSVEIERVKQDLGPIKDLTEKFGSATDKNELAILTRELGQADRRGDVRSARRISQNLDSLRWRVLVSQDWYWKNCFEAQNTPRRKFVNRKEAEKWLTAGNEAIREGDSSSLQEAVRHLWQLQPKSEVELDRERIMQSGLRSF